MAANELPDQDARMVSDQPSPLWLKRLNIGAGGLIMLIAGFMSISTQAHLAERIPDWASYGVLLPYACEIYAGLCTVNWSVAPEGSKVRKRGFRGVLLSTGLSEAMNIGEHAWAYITDHGHLAWGFIPIGLVGSIPTLLVVLAVHVVAGINTVAIPVPAAELIPESERIMLVVEESPAPPAPIMEPQIPNPAPTTTVVIPESAPVIPAPQRAPALIPAVVDPIPPTPPAPAPAAESAPPKGSTSRVSPALIDRVRAHLDSVAAAGHDPKAIKPGMLKVVIPDKSDKTLGVALRAAWAQIAEAEPIPST